MRASPTITDTEVQVYAKFCAAQGIIADGSQDGIANANFVRDYFLNQWNADITETNLVEALKQIRPYLKFYDENEMAFGKLFHALPPAEQEAFKAWKWPLGVKQNEYNATVLLTWIASHKFKVTDQTLALAAGQGKIVSLLDWDESAVRQHYVNPRQHTDVPTEKIPANEPLWKKLRREREQREAAQKPAEQSTRQPDAWQTLCEQLLRDGSHSQQAAMRSEFERAKSAGKSFRQTYSELEALKQSYKRLVPASKF